VSRGDPWSKIEVPPAEGDLSPGTFELDDRHQTEAGLQAGTDVVVRLGKGWPEIQCRLSYVKRAVDQAVFSRADWEAAGWPTDATGLTAIQLRRRTATDVARNAMSIRFLAVIVSILVAVFAIGPGLIWSPPSTATSAVQVASANQLAGQLAAAPHLSLRVHAEVAALHAELRAAQTSQASVQSQQHRYDAAYLVYALMVVLLAIAVALPQAAGILRIRRQKKKPTAGKFRRLMGGSLKTP
jgi:hypothetical protein